MIKDKYVAFCAEDHDYMTFKTFEEAKKWLDSQIEIATENGEGFNESTMYGEDFIAKITHRSHFNETDNKSNYHEHTDTCQNSCDEEIWEYDYPAVGNIEYLPVKEEENP